MTNAKKPAYKNYWVCGNCIFTTDVPVAAPGEHAEEGTAVFHVDHNGQVLHVRWDRDADGCANATYFSTIFNQFMESYNFTVARRVEEARERVALIERQAEIMHIMAKTYARIIADMVLEQLSSGDETKH